MANDILQGDSLEVLKTLPEKSINMCMTSPPYWALRDYGVEGQLGLEQTFEKYINKLCDIFEEVKRVLRDDGTCWVNLGDTYYTKSGSNFENDNLNPLSKEEVGRTTGINKANQLRGRPHKYMQSKSLVMIPMRFAIEMVNRGWILRNTIIWHKPNCMPSSVKDRFTVDFEYIFFFSKKKKYYFEQQLEPVKQVSIERMGRKWCGSKHEKFGVEKNMQQEIKAEERMDKDRWCNKKVRNKRTVWEICPKGFKGAHFAVFPEELCETPIKAGCPKEVCIKCGNPKVLDYELNRDDKGFEGRPDNNNYEEKSTMNNPALWKKGTVWAKEKIINGYKPTCKCNAEFTGGIVLDPFFGAGTTGLVALKQGKKFLGIELNKEYIEIANKRLKPFIEQTTLNSQKFPITEKDK